GVCSQCDGDDDCIALGLTTCLPPKFSSGLVGRKCACARPTILVHDPYGHARWPIARIRPAHRRAAGPPVRGVARPVIPCLARERPASGPCVLARAAAPPHPTRPRPLLLRPQPAAARPPRRPPRPRAAPD